MSTAAGRCFAAALVLTLSLAACADPQGLHTGHETSHPASAFTRVSASDLEGLAKEVRQATARFNSLTQASKAGYGEAGPCVAVAGLGGMGFHWVNLDLVDPVFDPLSPEALLYAPAPNGRLELLGVEYIVVDVGQSAPTFEGRAFDVGGAPLPVDHWTLHAWLHKENPSGLHAAFNPEVACP